MQMSVCRPVCLSVAKYIAKFNQISDFFQKKNSQFWPILADFDRFCQISANFGRFWDFGFSDKLIASGLQRLAPLSDTTKSIGYSRY